jgi:hypothetical protein
MTWRLFREKLRKLHKLYRFIETIGTAVEKTKDSKDEWRWFRPPKRTMETLGFRTSALAWTMQHLAARRIQATFRG